MATGSFLTTVPELMEWGLQGRSLSRRRIRTLRALSVLTLISEFIGAEQGLGYLINDGRNFCLVPQMLGAAVLLGLLGYAGNAVVRVVERRALRWQHPS